MKESHCSGETTCDRCQEEVWPEWAVRFTAFHASEPVEIVICDSCIQEMAEEMARCRDGGE